MEFEAWIISDFERNQVEERFGKIGYPRINNKSIIVRNLQAPVGSMLKILSAGYNPPEPSPSKSEYHIVSD